MRQRSARTYSQRLGQLSDDQLQAALDRFDLGDLLHAEPVPIGLFGQNVFLTSTKGEYVLRGRPANDEQFPKERFFSRLILERTTVPAPWPYEIDQSSDIFGWSYAVMPRMPGLQIGDPGVRESLNAEDRLDLARAMGEALARLHELKWPHCGAYDVGLDSISRFEQDHGARVTAWIQDNLRRSRAASDATTDADVAWVDELIEAGRGALGVPFEPTFVHRDYKEANATADRTGNRWRVTGVFDVGGAYFGDAEEDLCRSIAAYARESLELVHVYVEAYRGHRLLRPGFAERFPIYMLAECLIIWAHGQRNSMWFPEGLSFREWAERFASLQPF